MGKQMPMLVLLASFLGSTVLGTILGLLALKLLERVGYVKLGDWWRLGAQISVVNVIIWLGIGGCWWKLIGLW